MGLNFAPDDYKTQPELWLANQSGHMALGAAFAVLVCAFWFFIAGEFPYRSIVFAFIILVYLVRVELIGQGFQGWDTVEDTAFVTLYGSGPILYAFREIEPGSSRFVGDILDVVPFLVVAVAHLAIGALWRLRLRNREAARREFWKVGG